MKLINLNGILINLDNVMYMEKIYPGHKDWIGTSSITVDSYQIRFFFGSEDYTYISYGIQESEWRNDWDWLNSFAIDRKVGPRRSPEGGSQR